ncbi:MAG: ABC transporter ATP-binding protein [Chloroflexi bacterium RBG_13_68_17]|nr:MAG: ABC transporter ATP-binding protein [Chloroflexi bacterium RBG_13_68_17]
MSLLEVEGVTKHFGGLAAVSGVDLRVDEGEVVGLIGPNGAGKTTLFNLLSGALKPNSGAVRFRGEDITGLKPHQICRKGLARTFQSVKVFGGMSVSQNVLVGVVFGDRSRMSAKQTGEEVARLLEFVGLSAVGGVPAKDLTLANQKRVEVARALASKPELLLIDELMAGLNPTEVAQAMDLVAAIGERGTTVLIIEHVMKAIMGICGRIIVFHHGEKIAEGTPQEIATSRTVIEVYLGE